MEVLEECPPEKWIAIDELFRLLKAVADDFAVTTTPGSSISASCSTAASATSGRHIWEILQGRFVLAFLFEYAATLGLVDVAYLSPAWARNDFRDHWGTDELSCLSRYDGLMYFGSTRWARGAWGWRRVSSRRRFRSSFFSGAAQP